MVARNADPEFKEKQRAAMVALHADPEFNPLALLTPEQRAEYDLLRKKGGYSREDAMETINRQKAVISFDKRATKNTGKESA